MIFLTIPSLLLFLSPYLLGTVATKMDAAISIENRSGKTATCFATYLMSDGSVNHACRPIFDEQTISFERNRRIVFENSFSDKNHGAISLTATLQSIDIVQKLTQKTRFSATLSAQELSNENNWVIASGTGQLLIQKCCQ